MYLRDFYISIILLLYLHIQVYILNIFFVTSLSNTLPLIYAVCIYTCVYFTSVTHRILTCVYLHIRMHVVGATVGESFGDPVGEAVGPPVGEAVGEAVGL